MAVAMCTLVPQEAQEVEPEVSWLPQTVQSRCSANPQLEQNRSPGSTGARQEGQAAIATECTTAQRTGMIRPSVPSNVVYNISPEASSPKLLIWPGLPKSSDQSLWLIAPLEVCSKLRTQPKHQSA